VRPSRRGAIILAWLSLVPKQMSTGDRTILGHISKRGHGSLRMLFIQAARVILVRPANWPKHGFGAWLIRAAQRLHPNVLAVALANKLARSPGPCWHKGAAMKRTSRQQRPEMNTLRFTMGMAAALCRPPSLAGLGERATVASRGRLKLIPKARVGFPAKVCESK
jgi:Transposase IS116/IS110/IS902 family